MVGGKRCKNKNGLTENKFETTGIFPDLLHIVDLQLCNDVIGSCLLELNDAPGSPRDAQLQSQREHYEHWCKEQGAMAASQV